MISIDELHGWWLQDKYGTFCFPDEASELFDYSDSNETCYGDVKSFDWDTKIVKTIWNSAEHEFKVLKPSREYVEFITSLSNNHVMYKNFVKGLEIEHREPDTWGEVADSLTLEKSKSFMDELKEM